MNDYRTDHDDAREDDAREEREQLFGDFGPNLDALHEDGWPSWYASRTPKLPAPPPPPTKAEVAADLARAAFTKHARGDRGHVGSSCHLGPSPHFCDHGSELLAIAIAAVDAIDDPECPPEMGPDVVEIRYMLIEEARDA